MVGYLDSAALFALWLEAACVLRGAVAALVIPEPGQGEGGGFGGQVAAASSSSAQPALSDGVQRADDLLDRQLRGKESR